MTISLLALALLSLTPQDAAPRFAWADLDLDRRPDAVTVTPDGCLSLLGNGTDGTFHDLLPSMGLATQEGIAFVLVEDFDQDGDPDLFLGTHAGPSRLLRNDAGRGFDDVSSALGLDHEGQDVEAHWLDIDQDGLLDLQVIGQGFHRLYRAIPGLPFEVTELPPVHVSSTPEVFLLPAPTAAEAAPTAEAGDAPAPNGSPSSRAMGTQAGRQPVAGAARGTGSGPAGVDTLDTERIGSSSNCPVSIQDSSAPGSCLQAASTPTLGLLYPLSEDFFVSAFSGFTGIGTTNPDRQLSVLRSVANDGVATFDNPNPAGFAGAYFEEGGAPRGFIGHVNASSIFAEPESMQIGAQSSDLVFSTSPDTFFNERMRITADGQIGIGTADPQGPLHVTGMIRQGSESGTSQGPDAVFPYTGMVTRRAISTVTDTGSIVARSQFMRVERDGTNNGLALSWDAGSLANQVAYGTALTSTGTLVPIVINLGAPASAGTMSLFSETDVVRLDLMFGNVFNAREMTELKLVRENGDSWWVGHLISTLDQ